MAAALASIAVPGCRKMSRLFPSVTSEKQNLQIIALRAENPSGPKVIPKKDEKTKRTKMITGLAIIFCTKCIFSAAYWRQHIFRPSLRY